MLWLGENLDLTRRKRKEKRKGREKEAKVARKSRNLPKLLVENEHDQFDN